MNYTQNYQLPQWAETDRILMEDFNDMAEKIDDALADHSDSLDALQAADAANSAAIAAKGNCQLYTTSYIGTGTYGAGHGNTLTFPKKPLVVAVAGDPGNEMFIAFRGVGQSLAYVKGMYNLGFTWSGNTLSWYRVDSAAKQFNDSKAYYVTALLDSEE